MDMKKVEIFYCYHHRDEDLKDELKKQISNRAITSKDYSDILPGDVRQERIDEFLKSANILLLLISIDFISSYEEFMKEIQVALERHAKREIPIIAVILRSCTWEDRTFAGQPLTNWQILPINRNPVALNINPANREQVLKEIAKEVYRVAEPIKQKHKKESHLEQADEWRKQEEYEKAESELKEALECLPADEFSKKEKATIWSKIGDIRYKCTHWESALESYQNAINFYPGNVQTFIAVGQIYYQQLSKPARAIEAYTKAIELEKQNIELYKIKCALCLQSGDTKNALDTCDTAITRNISDTQLMRYRAQILHESGQYQSAYTMYQDLFKNDSSLKNDPNNAYLYKEYGDLLLKMGRKYSKNARDAYESAIEIYNHVQMNNSLFWNELHQKLEEATKEHTQELQNKAQ